MERARVPFDLVVGLREEMAELRTTVSQLASAQLGTLATALTAIAVTLIR